MPTWLLLNFQDASSPNMENMILFHDFIMMMMILIMSFITMKIYYMLKNKMYYMKFMNHQMLEMFWTILPMCILMTMAIPSIMNLYINEEINMPMLTFKIIAHQWYWSFELPNINMNYESFMIKNFFKSNFRLLDTNSRLMIPINLNIKLLVSSMDVIHSFTIPSLGIKIDACPGRLNQINFKSLRPGIFFGQCSEICGINHSFMPIMMEMTKFNNWINLMK
uniref:Cytochrome c oxidase subunit 2 n=1 Tax=Belyta sp. ZJUH_2016005 TaxID=2491151 RepID=A0A3Q8U9V4_9HYME|nr:cytochrome c oxidase subunit 2 [Belyta sp. ZJUH_2016005]